MSGKSHRGFDWNFDRDFDFDIPHDAVCEHCLSPLEEHETHDACVSERDELMLEKLWNARRDEGAQTA